VTAWLVVLLCTLATQHCETRAELRVELDLADVWCKAEAARIYAAVEDDGRRVVCRIIP
jgi:hypothetical protein